MKHDVVVIGAGLAGLTAARYLQESGLDVVVVESSDRPGGRVKSDYVDGYVLDHGFQVINPKYPEVVSSGVIDLCEFVSFPAGFRLVDGESSKKFTISRALSVPGSLREKVALLGYLNSQAKNSRGFGEDARKFSNLYSDVLEPFLRGVFLTDPSIISSDAAQKIIRSFISGRPGVPAKGVGVFSTLLAGKVNSINYNQTVASISPGEVKTQSQVINADFVVVATDPTTAHQLVAGESAPQMLASTTWYHSTSQALPDANLLAVQKSGSVINSVVLSSLVPTYAPAGKTLVSSTTLHSVNEEQVRSEMSRIWGVSTSEWELVRHYEIKESLPLHGVGTPLYSKQYLGDGIFVAGDHKTYPSQQGAMESGRLAAEEIIRRVGLTRQ